MSHIAILGLASREHADGAGNRRTAPGPGELDLRGMAVGWRDDRGDVRLDHTVPLARSGAVQGALSGGVGLFLLAPLLGAAVGGAAGAGCRYRASGTTHPPRSGWTLTAPSRG